MCSLLSLTEVWHCGFDVSFAAPFFITAVSAGSGGGMLEWVVFFGGGIGRVLTILVGYR